MKFNSVGAIEDGTRMVTVCNKCFRACCWHGNFMCDAARDAGTVDLTVAELDLRELEHPSYYSIDHLRELGILD